MEMTDDDFIQLKAVIDGYSSLLEYYDIIFYNQCELETKENVFKEAEEVINQYVENPIENEDYRLMGDRLIIIMQDNLKQLERAWQS